MHPQIVSGHEVTMRWFHFNCTQFVFNKHKKCTAKQMLLVLNNWFVEKVANCTHSQRKKQIFLVKLQIEQFWTAHYGDFLHYVWCNRVTIIQYERSAISSFLSHSIDSIERIQTGNILKVLSRPRRNKNVKQREHITESQMWINPEAATKYAKTIESLHYSMRYLTVRYPKNIKFVNVEYEDFVHSVHGSNYWRAIQKFLGIEVVINGNETWMKREHSRPCYEKIENWKQIKNELNGSDSVYACNMMQS